MHDDESMEFDDRDGYEEWHAMVAFQDWLDYQQKIADSHPRDAKVDEAIETLRTYAAHA